MATRDSTALSMACAEIERLREERGHMMSERAYALAVQCPICYAEPGDACCTEDGELIAAVHDSRVTDLRELASQGLRLYAEAKLAP